MYFIICEQNPVVLMDITMALGEMFPAAEIAQMSGPSDPLLPTHQARTTVLLANKGLLADLGLDYIDALITAGGGVVAIGDPETERLGLAYLAKPFCGDMLIAAVMRCLERSE